MTTSRCVGTKARETQMAQAEFDTMSRTCSVAGVVARSSSISYALTCTKDYGLTLNARVTYEGNFSAEFRRTETLVSTSIPTRFEGMTKTTLFRFKGQCSKGMLPGDTFTRNPDGSARPTWNRYAPPVANSDLGKAQAQTKLGEKSGGAR